MLAITFKPILCVLTYSWILFPTRVSIFSPDLIFSRTFRLVTMSSDASRMALSSTIWIKGPALFLSEQKE